MSEVRTKFEQLRPEQQAEIVQFLGRHEQHLRAVLATERLKELLAGYKLTYPWKLELDPMNGLVPGEEVGFRKSGISATDGILVALATEEPGGRQMVIIYRTASDSTYSVEQQDVHPLHK